MSRHSLSVALFSSALLVSLGCGTKVDLGSGGSGGHGGAAAQTGTGGGDPACDGKTCGDSCPSGDGGQHICDGFGQCSPALDVTCSPCPEATPGEGNACPQIGLVCEFDPGPVLNCRRRSTCDASGWHNASTDCSTSPAPSGECPGSEPSGTCPASDHVCAYEDAFCGCSVSSQWLCAGPPASPCPVIAPLLGAACKPEGAVCDYGDCAIDFFGERRCEQGLWVEGNLGCVF